MSDQSLSDTFIDETVIDHSSSEEESEEEAIVKVGRSNKVRIFDSDDDSEDNRASNDDSKGDVASDNNSEDDNQGDDPTGNNGLDPIFDSDEDNLASNYDSEGVFAPKRNNGKPNISLVISSSDVEDTDDQIITSSNIKSASDSDGEVTNIAQLGKSKNLKKTQNSKNLLSNMESASDSDGERTKIDSHCLDETGKQNNSSKISQLEKSRDQVLVRKSQNSRNQSSNRKLASDSDDESTNKIDSYCLAETAEHTNSSKISQLDKSKDQLLVGNLRKSQNSRISQQFKYHSEGILNSTDIHSIPQNKMWRLSTNIQNASDDISEPSVEILSDHDSDVIEVSSSEDIVSPQKTPFKLFAKKKTHQQTLHSFIVPKQSPREQKPPLVFTQPQTKPLMQKQSINQQIVSSPKETVSNAQHNAQRNKVDDLEIEFVKLKNMLDNMNLEALPDRGQLLKERLAVAERRYKLEKSKLEKMNVSETKVDEVPAGAFANVAWEDIEAGTNAVLPKTFGKQAMSTYNAQKAVTMDRLQQLHAALQTCPKEGDYEDDPKGLKVSLMPHQKRALAWALFREKEKPAGGILADDMGLGKTLTMISLVLRSLQLEKSDDSDEENQYIGKNTVQTFNGGSLIVCPASLLNQWSGEIDRHLKRGLISYLVYHGPKRETRPKKLSEYDVVITTYAIIMHEAERQSAAFKIKWRRIILDEAHTIRNYKAQTSLACCQLMGKSRWALTGTPMHNKELDMYALLKFLRCSPFDDLQVWKRWVGDKSSGGVERLHTVISSLMLRRTKVELMEKGALNCMPEKKWELIEVELDEKEMSVYHKVLIFSQTLFAQFLHQRAEKRQDYADVNYRDVAGPNQEYQKMRQKLLKLNKVKDVSQHEILVLLLRLRQICCHPSLITAMLDESKEELGIDDEKIDHLNLLDQLEKLNIEDEEPAQEDEYQPDKSLGEIAQGISQEVKITLKEASKGHLHQSDPVFAKERASSKIKKMLKVLKEKVVSKNEKAIVVSQWSSYLKLVATHLKECGIEFDQLDGQVPVNKRMDMVDRINNSKDSLKVLLLSLTAGGVGLNLVGANHLFLLDLHWNPQLENQAQDRIYRVGQKKPVFVYKFMAKDTIEERIKALQDKKLAMAEALLTGTKQAIQSKLSIEDLKMIFGM